MTVEVPPSPRRVLLVEDNPVNQRVALALLTRRGHRVTLVANGLAALDALERDHFDVVLMDIQMPVMDGLEATARIREREQSTGEHVYIVAVTANAMKEDPKRFRDIGMDAYLPKPIDRQVLYSLLESGTSDEAPAPVAPTAFPLDIARMRDHLADDEDLIADVIELFFADSPARLDTIQSAIDTLDLEAIKSAAHSLKGSAATMCANDMVDAARRLEHVAATGDLPSIGAHFARLVAETERLSAALRELQTRI